MLEADRISVRAGERNLLRDLSARFQPGELTLVTGHSGAGKTTLARCLAGTIPHACRLRMGGEVTVAGRSTAEMSLPEIARHVALVLQRPESQLLNLFVADEIAFAPRNAGLPVAEVDRRVECAAQALDVTALLPRRTAELSGGEKQRVAIASVLAMRPKLLVLDEPLAQLDAAGRAALAATLGAMIAQGMGVIAIEQHPAQLLPTATRELVISDGRLVADGPPPARVAPDRIRWEDELASAPQPSGRELIALEGVSVRRRGRMALGGMDLTVHEGECLALGGSNGAGKSTLAEVVAGVLRISAGRVRRARGLRVGLLSQDPTELLLADTVREEVEISAAPMRGAPDPQQLLAGLSLEHLADLPPLLLSAGEVRRLAFAATLAAGPDILILDEPAAALHPEALADMMQLAEDWRKQGGALVIISHDHELVRRYADRVIVLREGRIAAEGAACDHA